MSGTDPMLPELFTVRRVRRETPDVVSLELVAAEGPTNFRFLPGQFNMLTVFGHGEVPMSITGDAAQPDVLVHTTRAVGAVSEAICRLKTGDTVGIRGPYGTAWPVEEARGQDIVVVAGGMGLAPLRGALLAIQANRSKYGRFFLVYGARSPADLLYPKQLHEWRGRFDMGVHVTVDHADADWIGHVGLVTRLLPRLTFSPSDTVAMVCGPEVMMRYAASDLEKRGIDPERIYLSMERNMKCGVGLCGHCQLGPHFMCKDGPVFTARAIRPLMTVREL